MRHADRAFPTGKGTKRPGKRLLTVGTDCSVGKKYAALALEKEMTQRGFDADFCATGQTGVLIAGRGVAIDAVVADFISGAVEWIAPAAAENHWQIVEGQGSLFHPSFAGVTLGLLHGAQPDAFVVCHEPTRTTMRGVKHPLPSIEAVIDATVALRPAHQSRHPPGRHRHQHRGARRGRRRSAASRRPPPSTAFRPSIRSAPASAPIVDRIAELFGQP